MADTPPTALISPALLDLVRQLMASPAMKSVAALQAFATENAFEPALVELLVPVLMRFVVSCQSAGKLPQAADFVARVMSSAADFGPEMATILESFVTPPVNPEGKS